MISFRDKWRKYQTRAVVTVRLPAPGGGMEEHQFIGRLVREFSGYVILAEPVHVGGGKNREDMPLPGEKWLRRETIVALQRPDA